MALVTTKIQREVKDEKWLRKRQKYFEKCDQSLERCAHIAYFHRFNFRLPVQHSSVVQQNSFDLNAGIGMQAIVNASGLENRYKRTPLTLFDLCYALIANH